MNFFTGALIDWSSFQLVLVESLKIVLITALAVVLVKSQAWKRNLWHGAVVALIALCAIEYFGLSRMITDGFQEQMTSFTTLETMTVERREVFKLAGWPALVSFMWILGTTYLLFGFAWQTFSLRRILARGTTCDSVWLNRTCEAHRMKLGIKRPIRLIVSDEMTIPAAVGFFSPTIIIPTNFSTSLDECEQESVIIHELGHHRAGDPFWQCVINLMLAVLWWNPLVWWLRGQALRHSEHAADETSIIVPEGPVHLAQSLVKLGRQFATLPKLATGIAGRGESKDLLCRARHVLGLPSDELLLPDPARSILVKLSYGLSLVVISVLCFH